MRSNRGRSRAFSLVELLAVLLIISILTESVIVSFTGFHSTKLSASVNQTVDVFAAARQNSIAKDAYTAVVVKSQGTGAYSAYCLLQLTRQDDGSLGQWTVLVPWRYLSQGIVFESGQPSIDTFIYTSSSANLPLPLPTVPFQGQPIDLTTTTVYQCYQPDGTLLGDQEPPQPPLRLRLIEGSVDPSSNVFTYQGARASGQETSYCDLVFLSNTGSTKIERP